MGRAGGRPLAIAADTTPGRALSACGEPAVEGVDARRVPVGDGGQGQAHGEQVVGIHAGIDFLQLPEGLDHEAGADQKDEGERQFGGDEEGAEAIGGDGAGGASDSGFQGVVEGRGAHVNDGRQAEGDAGGHADGEGEEQHLPIDADFGDAGDAAGIGGDQQAESAEGQEDAEDRAGEGQQDAFDNELLKKPSQARRRWQRGRRFRGGALRRAPAGGWPH